MMNKYGIVVRRDDEACEKCMFCIGCYFGAAVNGADCLVDSCVSGCKLAQVRHEVQYRNKLAAIQGVAVQSMAR
jgi:hypothetical protein